MYLKSIVWRKSCLSYVLIILLFVHFFLFAYLYFFFLRNYTIEKPKYIAEIKVTELVSPSQSKEITKRSFLIDYENNVFLKDGKPFQYISGSLHYFRVPRIYWRDRLRKFRAAGLNVVCTYVEWSTHEPSPGNFLFTEEQDLEYFIQLAVEEDLLVILRPGPYICAERDFGGLPPWLITLYPDINLRTNDINYQKEVKKWFDVLLSKMQKYLYGNGGPIIMVQVENEYGSYNACNMDHKLWLRDLINSYVQEKAVLFTTDGNAKHYLNCGVIPDVYPTIDFGTTANVTLSFDVMRLFAPRGPLVNSEFYPGWLSHWEEKMQTVNTSSILAKMREMLDLRVNINFYMFFGGTNFGFMNGANLAEDKYEPQLTSYDYDAPLDEAGDPTSKYYEIRNLISKYMTLPNIPVPQILPKGNYGTVTLKPILSLFNHSFISDCKMVVSYKPKTHEELNLKYGYALYETKVPENISDPAVLYVHNVRDRVIVYVNRNPAGIMSRSRFINSLSLLAPPGSTLSLLIENQGRINYGNYLKDKKGLLESPLMNDVPLYLWTIVTFPFENVSWIDSIYPSNQNISPPAFYLGEFILPTKNDPLDTYIDMTGWGKGIMFVNNFNLGRYWPGTGSQVTLFVPSSCLHRAPEKNKIIMFETEYTHPEFKITFKDKPRINKVPPGYNNDFQ